MRRHDHPWLRRLILVGLLLMIVGPCGVAFNEGGSPPGPLEVTLRWRRVAYVLIPVGASLAIGTGIVLVFLDRRNPPE